MFKLDQRKVLITGASSGLGLAVARELALGKGVSVCLVARREDLLQEACSQIVASGGVAEWHAADLSNEKELARLCEWIHEREFSCIIASAGLTHYGASGPECWEDLRRVVSVNLMANMELYLNTRAVLGERDGLFCFVSSMGGRIPLTYQGVYSASKHALEAFALTCRAEQRGKGPRIQIFAPGGIDTPMYQQSGLAGKLGQRNPFNASPQETARALVKNLEKSRVYRVPGVLNRWSMRLSRLLSPRVLAWLTERFYRPVS